MDIRELMKKLMDYHMDTDVVVEINGQHDFYISEIYVDGSNRLCIAIKLDGTDIRRLD